MRSMYILLALMAVASVYFVFYPETDLVIHRMLYEDGAFIYKHHPAIELLYDSIPWVTKIVAVGGILLLLYQLVLKKHVPFFSKRKLVFLLLALIIGPGLLVNTTFKDNWGRARPSQIVEFGGDKTYSEPWVIADQCDRNCSFVSGHSSVAFYLTAFALLLSGSARVVVYVLALLYGVASGFGRMAQGGHFFSDVLFSALITLLVVHVLYYILFTRRQRDDTPSNTDRA